MNVIKNERTAEIVGLCFGDGSLTRRHSGKNRGKLRFQIRGHITEDKEHYDNHIKPLLENKNCMKRFLRGLFDTDRGVFFQKNYSTKNRLHRLMKINFGFTSKELISDVQN